MISQAPNAQFNKYLLVRASKPPSEMALSVYFITRPSNPTPFWDELSALLSAGAPSARVIEAANRYLAANDIGGTDNFSALAAGSGEIVRLISEGVRDGDIRTVNDLVRQRYSTLFAQGGAGQSVRQIIWDQLAALLVSGSGFEVGDVLLRVLRVLHIAEYQTLKGVNADERILGADVVIPMELRAFIELAQTDVLRAKKAAEVEATSAELTATVENVRVTLLARAGRQFLVQAVSTREAAPLPMGAAQTETDGQIEVVRSVSGKIELVLNARALSRLHTMPELEHFLLSLSSTGVLATQDTRALLNALEAASSSCDSVLLGPLPTAALVNANKELEAAARMIANGAAVQIHLLAEQIAIRMSLGTASSASSALKDVSHPNPIQPAGIGDLKIVKQQLQKYALGVPSRMVT